MSKPDRQLRASTTAARDEDPPSTKKRKSEVQPTSDPASAIEDGGRAQPTSKRRKAIVELYHCTSCAVDLPAKSLPDWNPSEKCDHLINTCTTCLKSWLRVRVNSGEFTSIGDVVKNLTVRCPECPELMVNSDIRSAASKAIYRRFDELDRRHTAEHTPDWRWCLSPRCRAGQVHKAPSQARSDSARAPVKDQAENNELICKCHKCGAEACAACDRPWHRGETCQAYQARIKDKLKEENQTLARISKISRKCPTCHTNIEKDGGCPHMNCTNCFANFCWECMTSYIQGLCECQRRRLHGGQ